MSTSSKKPYLNKKARKELRALQGERRERAISYWKWWVKFHETEKGKVVGREEKIAQGKEVLEVLGVI